MNRRQFAKTVGAMAALSAINPRMLWSADISPTATPASVSKEAAELYRKALVLDCNVLAGIGCPISDDDPLGVTKLIVGSGVNVVKATLGGATGNFEETVAAIAKAELLTEKQPEAFCKIDKAAEKFDGIYGQETAGWLAASVSVERGGQKGLAINNEDCYELTESITFKNLGQIGRAGFDVSSCGTVVHSGRRFRTNDDLY